MSSNDLKKGFSTQTIGISLMVLNIVLQNKMLTLLIISIGYIFRSYFTPEGIAFVIRNKDKFTQKEYLSQFAKCAMDKMSVDVTVITSCLPSEVNKISESVTTAIVDTYKQHNT